jgi:hypothetical protein
MPVLSEKQSRRKGMNWPLGCLATSLALAVLLAATLVVSAQVQTPYVPLFGGSYSAVRVQRAYLSLDPSLYPTGHWLDRGTDAQ